MNDYKIFDECNSIFAKECFWNIMYFSSKTNKLQKSLFLISIKVVEVVLNSIIF